MTVTVSFTPVETNFLAVANALVSTGPSTTSGFVDMLVNGENKGNQATFDQGSIVNGKYVIKPTAKVGIFVLVLTAETPASVLIESDLDGKKESKSYAVEPNKMLQLQFP